MPILITQIVPDTVLEHLGAAYFFPGEHRHSPGYWSRVLESLDEAASSSKLFFCDPFIRSQVKMYRSHSSDLLVKLGGMLEGVKSTIPGDRFNRVVLKYWEDVQGSLEKASIFAKRLGYV